VRGLGCNALAYSTALRLCSHATVVKSDYEAYSQYSKLVTDVIRDSVPLFEKSSIDEFYLDLTGMDKFFGCWKFTDELKQKVNKESGLPISYALASNKLVSKVATNEVKPQGRIEVLPGGEKWFLAPLSIMKMPGIGKETGIKLLKMGVETIRTLSEIPVEMLQNLLGKWGVELWRRAQGIDETPVVPYYEQKSISKEETFTQDTIDLDYLSRELVRMTEKIAFELRQQNKLTGCVTVRLRYSNFDTHTKQLSIPYTNADHILLKAIKDLFKQLFYRRMLIRLIGVRFTDLIPGNYQIDMFDDKQENIKLYQAIDSIKNRFGESYVRCASGNRE
jgi:DNA polymerase-4